MAQTYTNSKVNHVYFDAGTFQGDATTKRFLKAPFDQVLINGALYLQPSSSEYTPNAVAQTVNADAELARLSRQPGGMYLDLNPVIVSEHEMGCKDDANSWKGVHRFGWV